MHVSVFMGTHAYTHMFSFSYKALSAVIFVSGQGPVVQDEQERLMLVGAHSCLALSASFIFMLCSKIYFLELYSKSKRCYTLKP